MYRVAALSRTGDRMKLLGQVIYITLLSLLVAVLFYFFIGTRGYGVPSQFFW
jgi:high-affinity Fe2+/Pb2+ permease